MCNHQRKKTLDSLQSKRPRAKRTNYIKHGSLTPFSCPWQQLAEEWELITKEGGEERRGGSLTQNTTDADTVMEMTSHPDIGVTKPPSCFTVLRNQRSLRMLSGWCRPTTSKGQRPCRIRGLTPLDSLAATSFLTVHEMSLVWVRLSLLSKGKPELHAMVCAPLAEDLRLLNQKSDIHGPQEPPHKNHFTNTDKRRKKGSSRAATSSLSSDEPGSKATDIPSASAEGTKPSPQSSLDRIFGLWPDPLPSITSHCTRVTLGWVTQGDFSLSTGCGEALGFVSVAGLLHTLLDQPKEHRGMFLLRNPTSLHYRFAKINIEV